MANENNIFSLSGGKDSTAMVHMAVEKGIPIHSIVFFDTGWEFPQMYDHIDLVEKNLGIRVWRLQSRLSFEYRMFHRPIKGRKQGLEKLSDKKLIERWMWIKDNNLDNLSNDMPEGREKLIKELTGKVYRIGNGWPSKTRRWCTREKVDTIDYFCKPIPNVVQCIGYTADENRTVFKPKFQTRFPLQEWGITEADALQYCYNIGYHWGGLYKLFKRASCYCCPLQRVGELKNLRKHYPELWQKMLNMDQLRPEHNRGFMKYKTVMDFEKRFAYEDRQVGLNFSNKPMIRI